MTGMATIYLTHEEALEKLYTSDEVTELSIQPHISISTVQSDHLEITGYIFRQGDIVDSWEEGGVLIIHIQNCKREQMDKCALELCTLASLLD